MTKPRRPRDSARFRLAGNLRAVRKARGISQEELADLAGLHRTYVGSIERGERSPSLLNIARLALALKVKPGELMPDVPRGGRRGA